MKNNLEPRAKIGDVVISHVKFGDKKGRLHQGLVRYSSYDGFHEKWGYYIEGGYSSESINDQDILKNLTTNKEYDKAE